LVASTVAASDAMRVADEESPDAVSSAKGDHTARALVAQVAYLPPFAGAHLTLGRLQFAPAAGAVGAPLALLRALAQRHIMLPLERADAAPRDDERCARIRGHSSLMNLAQ